MRLTRSACSGLTASRFFLSVQPLKLFNHLTLSTNAAILSLNSVLRRSSGQLSSNKGELIKAEISVTSSTCMVSKAMAISTLLGRVGLSSLTSSACSIDNFSQTNSCSVVFSWLKRVKSCSAV